MMTLEEKKAYMRAYYHANKAAMYQQQRTYREANKEKRAAQRQALHEANREKVLTQQRAYREANKEKVSAYRAAHGLASPEAYSSYVAVRQAAQKAAAIFGSACCRHFYEERDRLTAVTGIPHEVDHVVPVLHPAVCGLHVPANLQVLTRAANREKGRKWVSDWDCA